MADNENTEEQVQVIQTASTEDDFLRVVSPEATKDEIESGISGCVVHLCGCK